MKQITKDLESKAGSKYKLDYQHKTNRSDCAYKVRLTVHYTIKYTAT